MYGLGSGMAVLILITSDQILHFSSQKYRALYDYSAADDDEVSFLENDLISEVTIIDDGWMEGRVDRTGQYGMLPSNYVERF